MNCHGNNNETGHKGHSKWLMILCCALPILIIGGLSLFKINNVGLKTFLGTAALFLCPLMHLLMLPLMFGRSKKNNNSNQINTQPINVEAKSIE